MQTVQLLIIYVFFAALPGLAFQEEEAAKKSSKNTDWIMLVTSRWWYADAGLAFPGSREVGVTDRELAPIQFLGVAKAPLSGIFTYQPRTTFKGEERRAEGRFPIEQDREDWEFRLQYQLPWTTGDNSTRIAWSAMAGYKHLSLSRDDPRSIVADDFNVAWKGPLVGVKANLFTGSLSINLSVARAFLKAEESQRRLEIEDLVFTEPHKYDAPGFFVDLSLGFYLNNHVLLTMGYLLQDYDPKPDTVTVDTTIPGIGTIPLDVATSAFRADGFFVEIGYLFSLRR